LHFSTPTVRQALRRQAIFYLHKGKNIMHLASFSYAASRNVQLEFFKIINISVFNQSSFFKKKRRREAEELLAAAFTYPSVVTCWDQLPTRVGCLLLLTSTKLAAHVPT
jgi:hypothetical protein